MQITEFPATHFYSLGSGMELMDQGGVRLIRKPVDFGWFNSILWEKTSRNKPKQAGTRQANRALVDLSLAKSCSRTEALRCIQIGLLCVQDNPNYRPLMSSVVTMLENETTPLSVPKQPVYFSYAGTQGTRGENTSSSVNNMTLSTVLEGR